MKIVIAMDSFKGSLTSSEAGQAAAAGFLRADPAADISVYPVADGGEGTAEALVSGLHGQYRSVTVSDPIGRPIQAKYGILPDRTAVIELAATSGLPLLTIPERDPMRTTTRGFGEMIRDAVRQGCRSFLLGIGGSATNDGGTGLLRALGFRFLDRDGKPVPEGAAGLSEIAVIDRSGVMPELSECSFHTASDVANPLCGETGCSRIFAPQKGAGAETVEIMETAMRHYADVVRTFVPGADPDAKGAGAAGGVGFALQSFLHAECEPGIGLVIRMTGLAKAIRNADLIVTGEGCLDAQTAMGKAPAGIAAAAKQYGKPVIAFSGIVKDGASACNTCGIDAFFPILRSICTAEQAMEPAYAAAALTDTAEQAGRLIGLYAGR
ncbi:MAG: glycerate kinase [Oscillospiraceae bacterium]|nr:glycerate kinase [Oscillospiraceae bacterium]